MSVFICLPVYNRINYTLKCIESIQHQDYRDYKIILCDDDSDDGTFNIISERFPEIIIIKGKGNLWWTGGMNLCVKEALKTAKENDFIFTLNNDTELFPDTIQNLVEYANRHKNSILGAVNLFYSEPSRIEPSAFKIKSNKWFFKNLHYRLNEFGEVIGDKKGVIEVSTLSGKGVLIPVEVFKKIGLFNYDKLPHYHADTEFFLRAKANGFNIFLSYDSKLLSHQELTGEGTKVSSPNIIKYSKSFFTIKSVNHLPSLYNYSKLIYKKYHIFYFFISIIKSIGGYFKHRVYF